MGGVGGGTGEVDLGGTYTGGESGCALTSPYCDCSGESRGGGARDNEVVGADVAGI